ncbi:MAG TPA: hypothetical protein PLA55_01165 [Candidatus Pacearchaeota archaeon]|nr:hypothetical protein [Methanofastidiosum sp.]HQF82770.1 hypothetical protein [Candidatus Pacearchaeota archaeon]HQI57588.1 hypothetical protein [Candidatus Pacearchaeota archaeon]
MDKQFYEEISLLAEYDCQFGGAQRMLSTISRRMKKPVYILNSKKNPARIWDITPIPEIPPTKIVFSPVVDRYNLQILNQKKHIKFCHSGTSLENFAEHPFARGLQWLTHRERVYHFWKSRGFNIDLVPKGYIPYDMDSIEVNLKKKDQGIFISRIHHSKRPDWAISSFQNAGIPLFIAGSHELRDYVNLLKKDVGQDVTFIPPDEGEGVNLNTRDDILRESKILVHCSSGGLHDYLEYSILDGLRFNCIPLCITPQVDQFSIIEERNIGKVIKSADEATEVIADIISNYDFYQRNAQKFMTSFINNQSELWSRWESKLEELCSKLV